MNVKFLPESGDMVIFIHLSATNL